MESINKLNLQNEAEFLDIIISVFEKGNNTIGLVPDPNYVENEGFVCPNKIDDVWHVMDDFLDNLKIIAGLARIWTEIDQEWLMKTIINNYEEMKDAKERQSP